ITDVRIDMEQALAEPPAPIAAAAPAGGAKLGWIVAGMLVLAMGVAGIVGWNRWSAAPVADRPLIRFSVDLGPEAVRGRGVTVILSPDGTRMAFVARSEAGLSQLYTR